MAIHGALGTTAGPDPFSLGDPAVVRTILGAAGFDDVAFAEVDEPVYYGPDVAAAVEFVRGFACTAAAMERPEAAERLRVMLAGHLRDDGVWLGSRAWIVSAVKR